MDPITKKEIDCPKYDPPKAKFKFDIKILSKNEKTTPSFYVHKCFRAGFSDNCSEKAKNKSIDSCKNKLAKYDKKMNYSTLFPSKEFIKLVETKPTPFEKARKECYSQVPPTECEQLNECEKEICLSKICGAFPKVDCVNQEVIQLSCSKQYRNSKEFISNPTPRGLNPIPPIDSPKWNRANSSNLTLDSSSRTIFHEVSHKLFLDDEYFDINNYPHPNYGEDDSIMRSGINLKPRHFDKMLEPLKCLK